MISSRSTGTAGSDPVSIAPITGHATDLDPEVIKKEVVSVEATSFITSFAPYFLKVLI